MTPEGKVKQWFINLVDRRYGHLAVWSYAPPGGRFGQAGIGDRLLLIESVACMVEIKSGESGYGLTPLQQKRLREFAAAGGIAASLEGKDMDKVNRIFTEIDRRRDLFRRALTEAENGG